MKISNGINNKNKKISLAVLAATMAILATGTTSAQQGPMVTFRFDDGKVSQYNFARPILAKYNFPATAYIFTDPPQEGNWSGFMNWTQIKELQNIYGWEIGSHSLSHPDLTKLNNSQLLNELSQSKIILENHGLKVKSFTSPFGLYDNRVLSYIARFYESHSSAWPYGLNSYPFSDYAISVQEVRNSVSTATIKNWIDEAVLNKKWLVLLFHNIVESNPTEYQYSKNDLEVVVDYVKTKNIPVVNLTEALKLPSPNLVLNSSFESTTGNWADNWLRTDAAQVTIDTNNNGNSPAPKNSLKFVGAANSIQNPGFESGTASWLFYINGTGSFNVVSPGYEGTSAAKISISTVGANTQLYQPGIALEPNTSYRLSFAAYSTAGHDMEIILHKHDSPYTNYGLFYKANLGASWQTFTTEFTTSGFTTAVNNARLQIQLGTYAASGETYYIDNVKLEKVVNTAKPSVYTKDFITVSPGKEYLLRAYFNCQNFNSGGVDVFIDEYNSQGNLLNSQLETGVHNKYVGSKAVIYIPNQNTAKVLVRIESSSGSDLTCYVDNVVLAGTTSSNRPPVITSAPLIRATSSVEYRYDVNAIDPDNDSLTYSLTTYPAGMTIDSANGLITWTPTPSQIGTHSVGVKVSDGFLTDIQTWTIEVTRGLCDFEEKEGRLIVRFNKDIKIRSDKSETDAISGPISAEIAAGLYQVTLVSYDGYAGRSLNNQPNERWYAILKNQSQAVITQTNPISDLPDTEEAILTEIVNENLVVAENVSAIIAKHAVYPDTSNANSVYPVCAVFDKINTNLIKNPSFESTTGGWADNWLRTDNVYASIDTNSNGSAPEPKNSLKLIGSASRYRVRTQDFIDIDPAKTYLLESYFNCQSFTSGGVDIFIDEYDSEGNWLSWKWQTGIWTNYVGNTVTYTPVSNVKKLLIWIESASGSNLTCYVDNLVLKQK